MSGLLLLEIFHTVFLSCLHPSMFSQNNISIIAQPVEKPKRLQLWVVLNLEADVLETTFVVSHFSDIRLGYNFVPSRIQKKPVTNLSCFLHRISIMLILVYQYLFGLMCSGLQPSITWQLWQTNLTYPQGTTLSKDYTSQPGQFYYGFRCLSCLHIASKLIYFKGPFL